MNTERGFTLVELVITMVLGTILLGIAAPRLGDFFTQTRGRIDLLKVHVVAVQQAAMNSRQPCGIRFQTDAPGYEAVVKRGTDWNPFAQSPIKETLPVDRLTVSGGSNEIFFDEDGRPVSSSGEAISQDVVIRAVAGEQVYTLTIDAFTGSIQR